MYKITKKVATIIITTFALMTISCNKDNSEDTSIVGTWGCVHSYLHNWGEVSYNDGNPYDNERTDVCVGELMTFKEDGTCTATEKLRSKMYPLRDGYYMINGSLLILNGSVNIDIQELGKEKLKLHFYTDHDDNIQGRNREWELVFKRN